jgi:formylglycine-generating enzyme required for sulfatase activity
MNEPVKRMPLVPTPSRNWLAGTLLTLLLIVNATAAAPAAPADPAKAEKEAQLLELFQGDSSITNSLDMVLLKVPQGFRVAQFEVTQTDYQKIMGDNPSRFPGPRRPVEQVSWQNAISFCERLTAKEREAGVIPADYAYALPTEAQWEHYLGDARLEDAITSHLGDRRNSENVGGLGPNRFGLYDTRGNVWEWCASPVARGASWRSYEDFLAINFRFTSDANTKFEDIGFRVVLQTAAGSR